ncbi:metal-dependent protease, putative molecular chaperone [Candidatus Kinetoplastibacterium desouzaii TCC079E]|uniref:Metal-dependent protease, putative molecular chaperone n=1 Tax=Candidatus Kinetoplastidibacterium desouzai TCC079E TaxID=1208919 RepID=M1LSC5_9PROT|nr:bifunctional tRNA (adenosine(37)-N6)-threonylcarbamoyltransferase complex dimerization subunit type 1 TsaB/ribosomal protein alanine acetyltransferase RimI [Candidatus Kinetoplastibacterium desouzaii]AGF47036.1 metal-dependent protease, putative molecular chaperone [Candidatus Kinetoplastibacterium desouzaii TCC079E]
MYQKISNLLAIESSLDECSISLISFDNQGFVKMSFSSEFDKDKLPSEYLLPSIDNLLEKADIQKKELNIVAFGKGPGKFTGIRLACATSKAIGMSLNIPIIAVDSLFSMAIKAKKDLIEGNYIIIAASDAKMNELYLSAYLVNSCLVEFHRFNQILQSPILISAEDISLWLSYYINKWLLYYIDVKFILVGNAWDIYNILPKIPEKFYNFFYCSMVKNPDSLVLSYVAKDLFLKEDYHGYDIEPLYIRNKVAFTTKELLLNKGGNPKVSSFLSKAEIRKMMVSDIENILLLESQIQIPSWSYANYLDSINSGYCSYIMQYEDYILGFFIMMFAPDISHLLRIAVNSNNQRMGVGSKLINSCVMISTENNLNSLLVEVGSSNSKAINFYRKHNFLDIGIRKNYYVLSNHKTDDAIVMKKYF